MATPSSSEDEVISGINVTPLVDIVLVILIVFIVTASMVMRSSIPINLPRAATAEEASTGPLTVALTKDSQVYINGAPSSLEAIPAAVQTARARLSGPNDKLSAFVSADSRAAYGTFATVVDRLRLEGVVDIALDTQPTEVDGAR